VSFEDVPASGAIPTGATSESSELSIRSSRYALMRTTIDRVDNLGQVLEQTAHGRLHAEDDAPGSERDFGEAIVSHSEPMLVNAGPWIWRTRSAFVDGHGTTARACPWA